METQETFKVVRHWYNGFAQNCYQLDNGTIIYIDYDDKNLQIKKMSVEHITNEHHKFNMTAEEKLAEQL